MIKAYLAGAFAIRRLAAPGERHHQRIHAARFLAETGGDLKASHTGEAEIEQDSGGDERLHGGERFLASAGETDGVAPPREQTAQPGTVTGAELRAPA